MSDRNSRQSFLGSTFEDLLCKCRVAIVGLGGGGSHVAQQLAHLGVVHVSMIDGDAAELSNLNRLVGATYKDAVTGLPKTAIAKRQFSKVLPEARVGVGNSRWQDSADLVKGANVVFGCVDSFAARRELEFSCRRYLIPYIDIGMDVHQHDGHYSITGQVFASLPGQPCLRCVGVVRDEDLAEEGTTYGAAGPRPQVVWSNGVLASTAVGLFVQMLSPWSGLMLSETLFQYDGDKHTIKPDKRPSLLKGIPCRHFNREADLGDPIWIPRT